MHWPSHRSIDPHTKALVRNLRDNNVGLSKVYTVIGSFFGSMENVPFNKRALRTVCAGISKDHSSDDVRKTYKIFSELKKSDPNFVDSCHVDKDGRIRALMWSNGKSRMQYKHFGDAITFDTTYRTNMYDMPFGLFVGVNNHFQSIIFGGVLITNETTEAFEWVFSEFVSLMGGKAPVTILTDQCRAMELAIKSVLPNTNHRMTSTQRSESANHMLKIFVPPGCSMNMFVRGYKQLQFMRDEEEEFQEKRSRLERVLLSSGGPIEKHASKIYTPATYQIFEEQIFRSASFSVEEIVRGLRFVTIHFDAEKRQKWSRVVFEVQLDTAKDYFSCDCGMYEHMGMICCHIIRVLSHLIRIEIPQSHILRRWTRNACRDLPMHLQMYQKESPAMMSTSFRHTALDMTAVELVQLGDSNPETFEVAMSSMLDVMPKLTEVSQISDGLGLQ